MTEDKNQQEKIKLKKKLQAYADSKNFKLNENEKALDGIITALLRNKQFKGEIYCPCRIVTGDKEKDKEIICPCVFHRGEIELQGKCKCTLFFNK
ncbi:MAG: ferredoxin-thioredoxin reductase catalytic domain-containing protein [archaeon]|nr:ferredoxin-thioredoxin reductase catalytic domain-containing protein [archaeon]